MCCRYAPSTGRFSSCLCRLHGAPYTSHRNSIFKRRGAGDRTGIWKMHCEDIFNNAGLCTFHVTSSNMYFTWRSVWSLSLYAMAVFGWKSLRFFLTFGYRKEELKKPRPLHVKGQKVFSLLAYSVMSELSKSNLPLYHYRKRFIF